MTSVSIRRINIMMSRGILYRIFCFGCQAHNTQVAQHIHVIWLDVGWFNGLISGKRRAHVFYFSNECIIIESHLNKFQHMLGMIKCNARLDWHYVWEWQSPPYMYVVQQINFDMHTVHMYECECTMHV